MSNIHGLGDYNSSGAGGAPRGDSENPEGMFGILTGNPGGEGKRPRDY